MNKTRIERRTLLGLGIFTLAAGARAAPADDPSAPIRALNEALLAIMRAGKSASFAQRFDMLAPVIDEVFDLNVLLRGAVGFSWSKLSPPDQQALQTAFRRFSIASWVANFDEFKGESFRIRPDPRPIDNGGFVVETEFGRPGGDPVVLGYVMRLAGTHWWAVDVLAQGTISRVAVLRSDFRHALSQGGATALLEQLRAKVTALGAG